MNVKNGFSTLNRLLGKKNKGHQLSKSSSNLNVSLTPHSIDTTGISSHLEQQNRITPLPVATSNAPFEQTFRITVLLPKDQLYVARLGAKTKLEKLLELVCENKLLDPEKYEFRHPVDTSQVFSCELTIGAVGLTEIRLCNKSEAYDNFNADEIIKLRHNTVGRDSVSSSEFSSRNSKHTLKTGSPYSSTNSLNSIDSSGMNTSYHHRNHIVSLPPQSTIGLQYSSGNNKQTNGLHPVAPARKKRVAPRPPSQNSIPEKTTSSTTKLNSNGQTIITTTTSSSTTNGIKLTLPRKDFHVSSPNLSQNNSEMISMLSLRAVDFHKSNVSVDCNGNTSHSRNNNNNSNNNNINSSDLNQNGHYLHNNSNNSLKSGNGVNGFEKFNPKMRPVSMNVLNNELNYRPSENGLRGSRRSYADLEVNNSTTSESSGIPEPLPRKRIFTAKKKAPAPPPRGLPPIAPRTITKSPTNIQETVNDEDKPKSNNVSKVMLNSSIEMEYINTNDKITEIQDETKESDGSTLTLCSENQQKEKVNEISTTKSISNENENENENSVDSEKLSAKLEELITSTYDAQSTDKNKLEPKRTPEISSDEDDNVNVYNLKLGKTIVKPLTEYNTNDTSLNEKSEPIAISEPSREFQTVATDSNSLRSDSPAGWTYTIPAPPNFADTSPNSLDSPTTALSNSCNSPITTELKINSGKNISRTINKRPDSLITSNNVDETIIITSDIEDGYHGGKSRVKLNGIDENDSKIGHQVLLENRESEKKMLLKENQQIENSNNKQIIDTVALIEQHEEIVNDFIINHKSQSLSPTNSLESFDSNKTDVINELHNVIQMNGGTEEIIRKTDNIEAVKPCALSNFKIQSYNKQNGTMKSSSSDDNDEKPFINGDINEIESEKINEYKSYDTGMSPYSNGDDDKLFKKTLNTKRSSLTLSNNVASQLFRSRGNITRSDSFHSTYQTNNNCNNNNNDLIQSRSSSYISLIGAQKFEFNSKLNDMKFIDTNRRKSSSELSIGESPSLQSLIVIKSIMNSRKNNLNNNNNNDNELQQQQEKLNDLYYKNQITTSSTSINYINNEYNSNNNHYDKFSIKNDKNDDDNIEIKLKIDNKDDIDENNTTYLNNNSCDSSKENSPKNKIISQHIHNNNNNKININNNNNNNNNNANCNNNININCNNSDKNDQPEKKWKYQGPPSINLSTWSERPKVQVSIKNDNDYKFGIGNHYMNGGGNSVTLPRVFRNSSITNLNSTNENNSTTTIITSSSSSSSPSPSTATPTTVRIVSEQPKVPFVRSVEYKKSTTIIPIEKSPTTTTTINCNNTNDNTITTINNSNSLSAGNTMTLGRMPKINRISTSTTSTTTTIKTNGPIVRGFKNVENYVKTDDDNRNQLLNNGWRNSLNTNNVSVERSNSCNIERNNVLKFSTFNNTSIKPEINGNKSITNLNGKHEKQVVTQTPSPFSQVMLRRTGLKEKILAKDENNIDSSRQIKSHHNHSSVVEEPICAKIELKSTQMKSSIGGGGSINQSSPPPPPPIIRSVVTKQNSLRKIPIDPHGELLSSIQNFNKDSLKRN